VRLQFSRVNGTVCEDNYVVLVNNVACQDIKEDATFGVYAADMGTQSFCNSNCLKCGFKL
jgi:hypothetical protein